MTAAMDVWRKQILLYDMGCSLRRWQMISGHMTRAKQITNSGESDIAKTWLWWGA